MNSPTPEQIAKLPDNIGRNMASKRLYLYLWFGCLVGTAAVLPLGMYSLEKTISWGVLLGSIVQASILYGVTLWLCSLLIRKTDLDPFKAQNSRKRIVYPGIIYGILVGLLLFVFDKMVFQGSAISGIDAPPRWMGAIGSIYGAVNEEILMRLFLFTFVYFLLSKAFKKVKGARLYLLWSTNVFIAISFGLGHLPMAGRIAPLSSIEITRILFLNGIAGITFGWLYFSKSLWTAMLAHFVADLMIHVFLV